MQDEKLPRGGGRLIALLAAMLLALAVACLIPVGQAQAQTVPPKYEIEINVQSGAGDLGAVRFKDENRNEVLLGPGETYTVVVNKDDYFELSAMPSSSGQIDFIKLDGAQQLVSPSQSDWIAERPCVINYADRNHRFDIAFADRDAPLGGVPENIGADGKFLVGMAYKVTGSPAYGKWQYDSDYVEIYDRRGNEISDGSVWIRALKPGTTTAHYGWGNNKPSPKPVAIDIGASEPGEHYIFALAYVGGQIDLPGNQKVSDGETKTFTVMPDAGYWIKTLEVDGKDVPLTAEQKKGDYQYTFPSVHGPHDIVATFEEAKDIVMPTSILDGYVGETLTVKPNPNYGAWSFDDEYVDVVARGVGADREFDIALKKAGPTTMSYAVNGIKKDVPVTVKAVHTVAASAGAGGAIDPKGDVPVKDGQSQPFTVTPNPGFVIDKVHVDGKDATSELVGNVYTFDTVTANHTIRATFTGVPIGNLPSNCELLVEESKTLSPTPGGGTWTFDVPGILSVEPKGGGFAFTGLKAGTTKATYTLNGASHEVAFMVKVPPPSTITATSGLNGTITPEGPVAVGFKESKTFTMTPDPHYTIDELLVDGKPAVAQPKGGAYTYTFSEVRKDHEIEVSYTPLSIDGVEDKELFVGESVSLTPTPGGGTWTYDAGLLSLEEKNGTCTFTGLKAGSTKVTYAVGGGSRDVTFTVKPVHTIVASAGPGGTIDPKGDVLVRDGHKQAFAVAPEAGYAIDKVLVDGKDATAQLVNGVYTFAAVDGEHMVHATFKKVVIGDLPSDFEIPVGGSVDLKPTPPGGTWTVDDDTIVSIVEKGGTVTVTGLKPGTAKATYTVNGAAYEVLVTVVRSSYTIRATAGEGGSIDPQGDVLVLYGADRAFAVAPEAGYAIDKVLVDGKDATAQLQDGVYTFSNVRADHTVEATFASAGDPLVRTGDSALPALLLGVTALAAGVGAAASRKLRRQ